MPVEKKPRAPMELHAVLLRLYWPQHFVWLEGSISNFGNRIPDEVITMSMLSASEHLILDRTTSANVA